MASTAEDLSFAAKALISHSGAMPHQYEDKLSHCKVQLLLIIDEAQDLDAYFGKSPGRSRLSILEDVLRIDFDTPRAGQTVFAHSVTLNTISLPDCVVNFGGPQ